MSRNIIETLTGALVIIVAVWFLVFFVDKTNSYSISTDNRIIFAKFDEIDSISAGAPVKVGGVKVGTVSSIQLDTKSYQAILALSLSKKVSIPIDSSAKVASSGLMGDKFIAIIPGGEEKFIENNGEIRYTESSVNLETLIGKMIYNSSPGATKKAPDEMTAK